MEHVKVLVCVGRDFFQKIKFKNNLDEFMKMLSDRGEQAVEIVHGGAKGADSFAGLYAESRNLINTECKADWDKYGRAAGPVRNQEMIDFHSPDYCIAFWDGVSRGTLDMITRSTKAGVQTLVIPYTPMKPF